MDRFMYWLQCSTCLSEPLVLSLLLLNTCGKLSHSSTKLIQLGRTTPIDANSSNKAQYFRAISILFPKKPFHVSFYVKTFLKKLRDPLRHEVFKKILERAYIFSFVVAFSTLLNWTKKFVFRSNFIRTNDRNWLVWRTIPYCIQYEIVL